MKWFVGAGLILLFAMIFRIEPLAYAMYALLSLLVVSRLLSQTWIQNLRAERACPQLTADVGDEVSVLVTIHNESGLPVPWVLSEELLPRHALAYNPPNLEVKGSTLQLCMFWGKRARSILYQVTCNRRGYYQLGPVVLETGDLFGLHRRFRVETQPHFLTVYPKVSPLEGYDIASKRPIGEVRMTYRLFEDPTRIAGVRPYQAGDPLNRINWRASARTGELYSKVYEPSTVAGVTLLVDFHRDSYDRQNEPVRSDLAVTATASIASAVYEMGQQTGFVTNGRDAADRISEEGWDYDWRTRDAALSAANMKADNDRLQPIVVETRRGVDQFMRIRDTLARLELTDGLPFPNLVNESMSRIPRDATVVAILRRVTSETTIALAGMKRHGFAVAAIINVFGDQEFADVSGPLLAEGIETHHLKEEMYIPGICRRQFMR